MADKLRWGILGAANIATEFVRAVKTSRISRVEAVASRDRSKARAWAESQGVPLSFGSYGELLKSGAVDLIYNPLPNRLHAEWTIRALEAGLPVLCEKPFTVDRAEALAVAKAAKKAGLHAAEAFMYRHHPIYDKVFEVLRSGMIGPVVSISSVFTFFLDDRNEIAASAELAGGALMDVGCYCVHLSRWDAGREPVRVAAMERRSSVDDQMMGLLDFPGGILARFETGIASAERHGAEISGTAGSIVLERPWHPGEKEARLIVRRWDQPDEVIAAPGANPYLLQADEFAAVCSGKQKPRWTVDDAIANMAVIDALYASAREGRIVEMEK